MCVCVRTSLNGSAHSGIFYAPSLWNMISMFKVSISSFWIWLYVKTYSSTTESHQYGVRHSRSSGDCCSLRDLGLARSRSLGLARCGLSLGGSSLLLGQLLSLLLLCKCLQTHTSTNNAWRQHKSKYICKDGWKPDWGWCMVVCF